MQQLGDFVMSEAVQVVQHEHLPVTIRKRSECPLERDRIDGIGQLDDQRRFCISLSNIDFRGRAPAPLAHTIDQDAREPGEQAGSPLKTGQCIDRADPGVVHDVLGEVVLLTEADRHRIQRRRVPTVQIAKRMCVPPVEQTRDQLAIRIVGSGYFVVDVSSTNCGMTTISEDSGVFSPDTMPTRISGCAGKPSALLFRYGE